MAQKALDEISERVRALEACLAKKGFVRSSELSTELHRHRFENVRRASQWAPDPYSTLQLTICVGLTDERLVHCAGAAAGCRLGRTCKDALAVMHAYVSHVYLIGGGIAQGVSTNTVERFSPVSGIWEQLPHKMPIKAVRHAAVTLHGRIYICGVGFGETSGKIMTYDPDAEPKKAWNLLGACQQMNKERLNAAVCVLAGQLYVCGGQDPSTLQVLDFVERLDPVHSTWHVLPRMKVTRAASQGVLRKGRILVCGGYTGEYPRTITSSTEIYDATSRMWLAAPPMMTPRVGHTAAHVSGTILVCGGTNLDAFPRALRSVESLMPTSDSWVALSDMSEPRTFSAICVVGHKVYVFGGSSEDLDASRNPGRPLSSVECYDLQVGRWKEMPPMLCPRENHAAVVASTVHSNKYFSSRKVEQKK